MPRTTPHYFTPKNVISPVSTRVPFLFERDETVRLNVTEQHFTKFVETETNTEAVMMDMVESTSQAVVDFPSPLAENTIIELPENDSSTSVVSESDSSNNGILNTLQCLIL